MWHIWASLPVHSEVHVELLLCKEKLELVCVCERWFPSYKKVLDVIYGIFSSKAF